MDESKNPLLIVSVTLAVLLVARWIIRTRTMDGPTKKPLYRVDHSVLNIPLPLQSLWMNMGYWKDTDDFPTACRALLEQVLKHAHILPDEVSEKSTNPNGNQSLSIIDLGYGCGDQSLYIRDTFSQSAQNDPQNTKQTHLKAYIGLTLEPSHFATAQKRLDSTTLSTPHTAPFTIFCADAANPSSWTPQIHTAISHASQPPNDPAHPHHLWILALDTLYHFQPSRWPVLHYASTTLNASLMAFDLCTADTLSLWQRIVIRFLTFMGQSPAANWVTVSEYRDRLVEAGYARDKIAIHDISEFVFGPLHGFMEKRGRELEELGMSIGRFRYAGGMFGWWGRSGVVRACVVVARK
ncbi:unnamed protein product [Periconia digitata]|uniref:S-adenosyl-L-methionine-dependent methyltransferase n=1 Tax=Periconia digitata TaxID=1303443 RepID=A0A9W4U945_9PLEO|nr:unnamed protein product [Periconia digitata]